MVNKQICNNSLTRNELQNIHIQMLLNDKDRSIGQVCTMFSCDKLSSFMIGFWNLQIVFSNKAMELVQEDTSWCSKIAIYW